MKEALNLKQPSSDNLRRNPYTQRFRYMYKPSGQKFGQRLPSRNHGFASRNRQFATRDYEYYPRNPDFTNRNQRFSTRNQDYGTFYNHYSQPTFYSSY